MIGAIFGDIVGSVYEFDNIKTKQFELFSAGCEFTDDTVMTAAVAKALMIFDECRRDEAQSAGKTGMDPLSKEDLDSFKTILVAVMHKIGKLYPRAGYGRKFGLWLMLGESEPYGSYGNGSAMRVSPVAWYASSLEEALLLAEASAAVTHNHPEGIKGAVVTAGAAYLARTGADMEKIKEFVCGYYDMQFTLDEIRPTYCFNETCQDSVPQAMQAFFESTSFEDAIRNAISIGGDSDTIGAICGAVAEAYYGMTERETKLAFAFLDARLSKITKEFTEKFR